MNQEFAQHISENKGILLKVCKMYCRTREDEQDLFQDIVLQLWKAFPSFRGESKQSTWTYRIALNTAITQLRKRNGKPIQQSIDSHVLEIPIPTHDPKDEQYDLMMTALNKLSKVEKGIMVLYLDDYRYSEIAEIIGITESNVGFKINRIKNKIRSTINSIEHGN